ncbi:DUF4280 domain-containing protein [Chondromyces crocatus]|uniref:DUF4280 domain-containing protein n=1 Tax=Chondromyces crocatus TaxID=52 RepID=A0A0K1ESF2_CHOCO|nr:DUF4280 domain-containing protein [Chondromyces crocatus]AKT43724.1 uncharacterized protein CMC5_079590 [Chondromyces crocatus]
MARLVVDGATLRCNQGSTPGRLSVATPHGVAGQKRQAATVDDHRPNLHVASFGMCRSMSNPQVSAATSAANGVLTPQPCVPATPAPWQSGHRHVRLVRGVALTDDATCACQWGGTIEIADPGAGGIQTR